MAPIASNGSQLIYHRLIKPVVLKYQDKIDDALDKAADKLQEGKLVRLCRKNPYYEKYQNIYEITYFVTKTSYLLYYLFQSN